LIAYIFATCVPGEEAEAISKIKKIPNVVEVNGVMGKYDIFVKILAKGEVDLHSTITNLREITPISGTSTFAAIQGQGGSIDDKK
jgi:DNA-binding Lrp family transcriptional regulator